MTLRDRFDAKWTPEPTTGCWLWFGQVSANGYGRIRAGTDRVMAHRVSFELNAAPIPDGQIVRHRCDNRACVNPDHLETGTQLDNIRDRAVRGRNGAVRGAAHWKTHLTEADVLAIRAMAAAGGDLAELAKRFGVTRRSVEFIVERHTWKHLREAA